MYLADLSSGSSTLVSASSDGTPGDGWSAPKGFNPDGTKVLFVSNSGNLVGNHPPKCRPTPGTYVQCYDVYLRDLAAGTTTLVSKNVFGTGGNGHSTHAQWVDTDMILFNSDASDLDNGDGNASSDIFLSTGHETPG